MSYKLSERNTLRFDAFEILMLNLSSQFILVVHLLQKYVILANEEGTLLP